MSDTPATPSEKRARVRIENVNHPGASTSVDAGMYEAMRAALIEVLPASAPGLTEGQIRQAVLPHLPAELYPAGERAGWWAKAVQLDLEAKGLIARETSRPLRWHRPAEPVPPAIHPPRDPGGQLGRTRTRNTFSK